MKRLALVFVLASGSAFAQYVPPDQELWGQMARALADLPMSLTVHQQVQQIMESVQREARLRAAKKEPTDAK